MADNVNVTAGSGVVVRSDEVGGVQIQVVKIALGGDGAEDNLVDAGSQLSAASVPVTLASDETWIKAEDAAHSSGDKGVVALTVRQDTAAALGGTDADYQPLITDANGRLHANALVGGSAAAGAAVAGNPVPAGVKALSALPAVVDTGDVSYATADLLGRVVTVPHCTSGDVTICNPAVVTDNAAHDVTANASGAGLKYYLAWVIVTNSDATVGTLVTLQDDNGTPVKLCQGYAAAAGGGFCLSFPVAPPCTGANQKLQVICGTTSSETYVSCGVYKAP